TQGTESKPNAFEPKDLVAKIRGHKRKFDTLIAIILSLFCLLKSHTSNLALFLFI
ncbi:hypothetical protein GYMLUDRAFT_99369, partial [Collybiopsis luxurians FD-317 M1]